MAYVDFKYFTRRTASDKVLRYKAFNIAKNRKYEWYQHGLAWMVYKSFDKKASGGAIKNQHMSNEELAKKFRKPIIRKFEKKKSKLAFYREPSQHFNVRSTLFQCCGSVLKQRWSNLEN